jgi:RimJ/RimL family protein N-acetyltransferase
MCRIREVDESNKQWIIDHLKRDVVRHVFAFYDLQQDPEHTAMYAAVDNDRLTGYILVYTALEFPSVILEGDEAIVEKLIEHVPANRFIIHATSDLLACVKNKFPEAKHYVENWMLIKKDGAKFFRSEHVRRLTVADGSKLAALFSSRKDRHSAAERKYSDWIRKMPTYGVFMNGELVSYAGSFIQTPQIWMIGGVYTNPSCRNKGYATLATSAITEEALGESDTAALFARSDNYAAIRAYGKIGYWKIGERLWIDVGTELKP